MTYHVTVGQGFICEGGVWTRAQMQYLGIGGGSPLGVPIKEAWRRVSYNAISGVTTWTRVWASSATAPTIQPSALTIVASNLGLSRGVTLGWTEAMAGVGWTLVLNFANDTDPTYNAQYVLGSGRSGTTQLVRPCGATGDIVEFNAAYQDPDNNPGPVTYSGTFTVT